MKIFSIAVLACLAIPCPTPIDKLRKLEVECLHAGATWWKHQDYCSCEFEDGRKFYYVC
jgi:hypothetical protein